MKKITLLLLVCLVLPFSLAQAGNQGGKGLFMKHMAHANPVPNYVAYIKKNPEALNISKEQMDQVMAWNKANGPKMHDMVVSVIETEKKMAEASMDGVSAEEIIAMAEELGKTRLEIIAGKTRCRDRMLEILNDEQWGKLTAMIKSK
jgi:hypothetical protein